MEWSEKGDEECKDDDENNDQSFKVCDHKPTVYHANTEKKRKRWSKIEEDDLED